MTDCLKIGLIGAGVFAGYHAIKLAAHPRVQFTGVTDVDPSRATKLASLHNIQARSLEALLDQSEAVVIATAASSHGPIALKALKAGCHCLIEKPLSTTKEDAEAIAAFSSSENLVVQVGHQERLVLRAIGLDRIKDRPLKIEAIRNSTFSPRGTDTSVTLDLMSHDIDLCTALMGQFPVSLIGQARCVRSNAPDMSQAKINYGGSTAILESSRVADASERRMKITYRCGIVDIDFNAKTMSHTTSFDLNSDFAGDPRAQDSLGAATDIFVRAVLDKTPVLVTAQEGAIAAITALQIDGVVKGEIE